MTILIAALERAATAFLRTAIPALVVTAIIGGGALALLLWPWTQLPFLIFGLAPAVGGYVRFIGALARGEPARWEHLGAGVAAIDRWTGVVVMSGLHMTLALLPLCVGIALGNLGPVGSRWIWWTVGGLGAAPLVMMMLLRLLLVPSAAAVAPAATPVAAIFETAAGVSERHRETVLGAFGIHVCLLAGVVASTPWSLIVAAPLAVMLQATVYDMAGEDSAVPRM